MLVCKWDVTSLLLLGFLSPEFGVYFFALQEKEMATHSSILAWRIPWAEEPDGLLSMGSHRISHD